MNNLFEKITNNSLWMDFFNLFTGILLVVIIILFCLFPGNKIIISLMFLFTGIMNLSNGIKRVHNKNSRNMGMVLIMISIITLVAGIMFVVAMG